MTRPHEDRQEHTLTDHKGGGPAIALAPDSWWALAVVHVAAAREPSGIASYETLVEKARASAVKARESAVLRAHNHRRVLVFVHLGGHESFKHLASAWDDHHLVAERHAVAESHSLELYRLMATAGVATIDPASTDAYAFERVAAGIERARHVASAAATAPGFVGIAAFGGDDGRTSAILYRFNHLAELEAFRTSPPAHEALGAAANEALQHVYPVRTFGPPA